MEHMIVQRISDICFTTRSKLQMILIQTHYLYDPAGAEVNTSHGLCSDSYSLLSTRSPRVHHDYIDFQFFYGQLFRSAYEEALDAVKLSHRQYPTIVELHQFKNFASLLTVMCQLLTLRSSSDNQGIQKYV